MNNTAVFTVVYPGAECYLPDFFNSIREQDDKKFDVVVLNDGVADFSRFDSNCVVLESNGQGIAKNREIGLKYLKEKYDNVIFLDADDTMSRNRVSSCKKFFEKYQLIVNEVNLVNSNLTLLQGSYFSKRLGKSKVFDLNSILDYNFCGFSNSAVSIKKMPEISLPKSLIAVDWCVFTHFLRGNVNAIFTSEAKTNYRQHLSNTIGLGRITIQKLLFVLDVKIQHYKCFCDLIPSFRDRLKTVEALKKRVNSNSCELYDLPLNSLDDKNFFWWEEDLLLKEKYEN
ncbi:MAG: glycosyltransferase [Bdellovibrionaceae bacterium]|nr:glycosyltransferase [Pseudobdellovibrionaceae bacterium]